MILHFHLQPQYKYEFHIYFTVVGKQAWKAKKEKKGVGLEDLSLVLNAIIVFDEHMSW